MKAQTLYDLREKYGFCSGADLSEFLHEQVGDMSPSGKVEIDHASAKSFVLDCIEAIKRNNNGDDLGTRKAEYLFPAP